MNCDQSFISKIISPTVANPGDDRASKKYPHTNFRKKLGDSYLRYRSFKSSWSPQLYNIALIMKN